MPRLRRLPGLQAPSNANRLSRNGSARREKRGPASDRSLEAAPWPGWRQRRQDPAADGDLGRPEEAFFDREDPLQGLDESRA